METPIPLPTTCHKDNAAIWNKIIRTLEEESDDTLGFISFYAPVSRQTFQNHLGYQVAGASATTRPRGQEGSKATRPVLSNDAEIIALGPDGPFEPSGYKINGELLLELPADDSKTEGIPAFPRISIDQATLNNMVKTDANPEHLQWPMVADDDMSMMCDYYLDEDEEVTILINPSAIIYQLRCLLAKPIKHDEIGELGALHALASKILTCCLLIAGTLDGKRCLIPTADKDKFRKLACSMPLNVRKLTDESKQFKAFREKLFELTGVQSPDDQIVRILASVIQDWVFTALTMIRVIDGELA